jgi:hypothetical protein
MMRMVVGRAEPISAFITTAGGLPDRAMRSDGMKNKKTWSKPELIALVRGKPEEAVLLVCKGAGTGVSSSQQWTGCARLFNCSEYCQDLTSS